MAEAAQAVRSYALLAGMAVRASMAYRASFAMLTVSQFLVTFIDFAAIVVMFSNVSSLGGFGFAEIALLYAVSSLGLGVADLLAGNCERLGRKVRDGSFDVMLIRPAPALVQVATDAFSLRRLGRIGQAVVVLVWSLVSVPVDWTVTKAAMLVLGVVCGVVIFSAVFVIGGAFQLPQEPLGRLTRICTRTCCGRWSRWRWACASTGGTSTASSAGPAPTPTGCGVRSSCATREAPGSGTRPTSWPAGWRPSTTT